MIVQKGKKGVVYVTPYTNPLLVKGQTSYRIYYRFKAERSIMKRKWFALENVLKIFNQITNAIIFFQGRFWPIPNAQLPGPPQDKGS